MAAMSPLSKGGAEPVANQVDRVLWGGTRWRHHAHGPGGCCVRPNEQVYKYEVRSGGVISFRVPVYQKVAQRPLQFARGMQQYRSSKLVTSTLFVGCWLVLQMMVAALSGVLGTCCIYPLDVAKNRTQTSLVRTNVVQQLRAIVREGGLRGMYRGLPANLVGVAPEKVTACLSLLGIRLLCRSAHLTLHSLWQALKLGTNDVVRGFLSPSTTALRVVLVGLCQQRSVS